MATTVFIINVLTITIAIMMVSLIHHENESVKHWEVWPPPFSLSMCWRSSLRSWWSVWYIMKMKVLNTERFGHHRIHYQCVDDHRPHHISLAWNLIHHENESVIHWEEHVCPPRLTTTTSVFIFNFLIVIMIIWIANMMAISSSWQQQLSLDLYSVHRIGIYPHTSYLSFLLVRKIAIK